MSSHAVVDTNVLVALVDERDKWHVQADALLTALETKAISFVYFDSVVNETVTVLARRLEEQSRSGEFPSLLDKLLKQVPETRIQWLSHDTRRLFADVMSLVRQTSGALNFHDALIALGCRDLGLSLIVSFDADFDGIDWLNRLATPEAVRQGLNADDGVQSG